DPQRVLRCLGGWSRRDRPRHVPDSLPDRALARGERREVASVRSSDDELCRRGVWIDLHGYALYPSRARADQELDGHAAKADLGGEEYEQQLLRNPVAV